MIDWNKRNGGFLSPESVYDDQLGNLSAQLNAKDKEIERLNNIINTAKDYIQEEMCVEPRELYGLVSGDDLILILNGIIKKGEQE